MSQLDQLRSVPATPAHGLPSQSTQIEQSRATAEVHGAIVVAQQVPRDINRAVSEMELSCSRSTMAERAFFTYRRAGSQITGPSVHFARELARCWGNMQYGLSQLHRSDERGETEMLAWAWDVQMNTRAETRFFVKHVRDRSGGEVVVLTDQRDIYERLTNDGARRLREMILNLLPEWFVEEGKRIAYRALEAGDGTSLEDRIAKAVEAWESKGISAKRLEARIGKPRVAWAVEDVALLSVIWGALTRGETTVAEEFPADAGITAADVIARRAKPADQKPTEAPPASPAVDSGGYPVGDDPTSDPNFGREG